MHKIFTIIFCSVFFLCTATTLAQDSTIIKTEKMPLRLLPVPNPLEDKTIDQEPIKDPVVQELDSFQKDIIRRIADIYQLHVLSLESRL
ncbi:MAG TPA: lytic transglycosylase, partial [Balneola sp.]|nr:lytic transglycosylase [Balneola sp.]